MHNKTHTQHTSDPHKGEMSGQSVSRLHRAIVLAFSSKVWDS